MTASRYSGSGRQESSGPNCTKRRTDTVAPGLFQIGHAVMLITTVLAVAPGLTVKPESIIALCLLGGLLYAVEALGGVYDVATEIVQEVRA